MRKLIIILLLFYGLVSGLAFEVMAQNGMPQDLPKYSEPFPTTWRLEGLVRPPAPASPGVMPKARPSYAASVDFESSDGSWSVTRSISFSTNNTKNGVLDNIRTFIAVSNDNASVTKDKPSSTVSKENKSQLLPSGVKIGSGLAFYLPVGQNFSAFAQVRPSLSQIFTAPHTMVTAGFQVPLVAAATPAGHNLSLKFSATMDQQFRPIMSFTINLTPFRR